MRAFLILCIIIQIIFSQDAHELISPNQRIKLNVTTKNKIQFDIYYDNTLQIEDIEINLRFNKRKNRGKFANLVSKEFASSSDFTTPVIPIKNKEIVDQYNTLVLVFMRNFSIEFRAYNDGVAYRFIPNFEEDFTLENEEINISLPPETFTYFHQEESLYSHYERSYTGGPIVDIKEDAVTSLPLYLRTSQNLHLVVTEADVFDYPNLFLERTSSGLQSRFPKVPSSIRMKEGRNSDRTEIIDSTEKYIVKTKGKRNLPWRVFIMSDVPGDLVESELVYLLSSPNKLENTDWIRPGKVAWDWWNALNLEGVDFTPGLNLQTYKYYVDFASKYGIEYVILDEGWSKSTTIIKEYKADLNVEELITYAKSKNVGIILWVLWKPLNKDMDAIFALYEKWGAKGVKIDFMQRADQIMVNFYERSARLAANHHLIVDYHGAYKPTGLHRAYPNILNFEGVKGLEHNKWSKDITPEHNLILPFTRQVAGPMDYTPGAMINAHPNNFKIEFNKPMSMTTRAQQVAMYIIYDAPLQMLADAPTRYETEDETTKFIAQLPTTWDKTRVFAASVGEFILIEREKNEMIYLGAMTNSKDRKFELNMNFLNPGQYQMTIYKDGPNAETNAEDYVLETRTVSPEMVVPISLATGGGWTAILKLIKEK